MKYTKKQINKAFLEWNKELRTKPDFFFSEDECILKSVEEVASESTRTLINYIKKQ